MYIELFIAAIPLSLAYWMNFFTLPQKDRSHPPLPFMAFIAAYFLTFITMLIFALMGTDSVTTATLAEIAIILEIACIFYFFPNIKQAVVRSGGIYNFFFGMMTWFICMPIVLLTSQVINMILNDYFQIPHLEQVAVSQLKEYLDRPLAFTVLALTIIIFVPIIEEILVRGFLQTLIKRAVGIKFAIPITSVIFAFLHFAPEQGMQNIDILISLFVFSCFLGFIYERQNSILASIGLHCTFNAVTVVLIASNSLILV